MFSMPQILANSIKRNGEKSNFEKGKGTQFDPKIADVMLQLIDEDKDYNMREKD